ncbi:hypothetical protein BLNAU_3662 [Blattamonas nauphoetae]|uniref:t-SNARE coiled-coil homology domain-containing protein n=1 Tax=Blattamonas nauphoetae TaxID=2049346 RepID=A0ABQ9YBR3_9EUKA|nr:hypothetical protein BLNAU_3662 [Blattamonas nauphoetae]
MSADHLETVQKTYDDLTIHINEFSDLINQFGKKKGIPLNEMKYQEKSIASDIRYLTKLVRMVGPPTNLTAKNWTHKKDELESRFNELKAQFQAKQTPNASGPGGGDAVPLQFQSEKQKYETAQNTAEATEQSLKRTADMSTQAVETMQETNLILQAQTEQLERVASTLETMDGDLDRAKRLVSQILRGLWSDKLLVVLLFLIVLAIVGVLIAGIFIKSK